MTLVVEVLVDVLGAHRTAGRYRVVGLGPLPVRVSVFPVDCKRYAVGWVTLWVPSLLCEWPLAPPVLSDFPAVGTPTEVRGDRAGSAVSGS